MKSQSLKLGAAAQTLPIVFGYGATFLATPFMVSQLGLANFGLWALTGAIAQYGTLLDFGISRGIVRFVANYHSRSDDVNEKAVVGAGITTVTFVGLSLVFLAVLLPRQLGSLIGLDDLSLSRALFSASATILATGMVGLAFAGASIGRGRAVAANIGLACQRLSVVTGGVIALLIAPELALFAYGSAIGGLTGLLFTVLAITLDEREIRIGKPSLEVFRELFAFGLKGQILLICDLIFSNAGKIILGVTLGPAAAGAYELGSRLAFGARAIGTSTSTVLIAHLSRSYASRGIAAVRDDYCRLVQKNAAVGNFTLFLLAAISIGLVPAWLGFENTEVVLVTVVLALSYTTNVLTGVAAASTAAINRLGGLAITAVISTVLTLVVQSVLVQSLGFAGVLAGTVIGSLVGPLAGIIIIHRNIKIPLRWFFKASAGPTVLGILSAVIAMCASLYPPTPHDRSSAIPSVMLGAFVFFALYLPIGWRRGYFPNLRRRL